MTENAPQSTTKWSTRVSVVAFLITVVIVGAGLLKQQSWTKESAASTIAFVGLFAVDQIIKICGRLKWMPRNCRSQGFYELCFEKCGLLLGGLLALGVTSAVYAALWSVLMTVLPPDVQHLRNLEILMFVISVVLFSANVILIIRARNPSPPA